MKIDVKKIGRLVSGAAFVYVGCHIVVAGMLVLAKEGRK